LRPEVSGGALSLLAGGFKRIYGIVGDSLDRKSVV
jgi:hypothetical protein